MKIENKGVKQMSIVEYLELIGNTKTPQGVRKAIKENRLHHIKGVISASTIGNQFVLTVDRKAALK